MAKMLWSGNTRTAPRWMADFHSRGRERVAPAKLDVTQFTNQLGVDLLVTGGGAAANATSIPVVALTGPAPYVSTLVGASGVLIRAGTQLLFGPAANKKFAVLTADAKVGDTSLAVSPLVTALVAGDDSRWQYTGGIFVPSGVIIGRTFAQRAASPPVGYHPGDVVTPDDELGILLFDIVDLRQNNDCEILRPFKGVSIKENYLPGYANLTTPQLTWLRANFDCILGVN